MSDRMRTVNSGLDRQVDDLKQLMDHMQLTIKKKVNALIQNQSRAVYSLWA